MTKVVLEDTASGYAISTINNNFETIESELNDKVLYRDNPDGEPNQMENLLDMNAHRIINLGAPVAPNDAARLADIPFAPFPIGTTTALLTTVTPFSTIAATNAQGALEEIVSDLSSTASLTQGAGTVGFLYSLNYVGNTVGRWLKDLATSAGSTFIGFIQAGAGAVLRTVQAKLRELPTPEDYGAVGDGVADDSAAFTSAFAANNRVVGRPNSTYKFKDITLSNGQVFDARGAYLLSASGATFLFKLTNFAARVKNFYLSDASTCSEAAFVFDNGRFCEVCDGTVISGTTVFKLKATVAASGTVKPSISRINAEGYTGIGIDLGPNVVQLCATDVFLDGGGSAATHGVSHISTGSIVAHGGHTYNNVRCERTVTGWIFTDATLTEVNGGWADTCTGAGVRVTGASDHLNINDFFIGTCTTGGLSVENTSTCYVNGLETFAASDTVSVLNTSTLFMDMGGWRGSKAGFNVATGATFNPMGADRYASGSVGTIPVSTTTYLGVNGVQATEADTSWRAPFDGYLIGVYSVCTVTPVSTHAYTARTNGGDSSLVATITAGGFAGTAWGAVSVSKGTTIDIKVATSTTNASRHNAELIYASL